MNKKTIFALLTISALFFALVWSCGKEDIPVSSERAFGNAIQLFPYDLPTMQGNICYELWLVDINYAYDADSNELRIIEEEMSLGRFYWDRYRYEFSDLDSNVLENVFPTVDDRNVYGFNTLMITFEPLEDDGVRANNGLLYADIEFGQPVEGVFDFFGMASPDVVMELVDPDEEMTGDFVLRTYSDDGNPGTDMAFGLWFHAFAGVPLEFTHTLRTPAFTERANFCYEGWITMPGTFPRAISTGKFKVPYLADWSNPYLGPYPYRSVPGEDFLQNPPTGFEDLFPLELFSDGTDTVFISIEPFPDPDPLDPFPLRIFDLGRLPSDSLALNNTHAMKSMYGQMPSFDATVLEL
jgi:hypothetical protein